MRLLLVGNYELGDAKSMPRFGEMLRREMAARGHEVRLLRPKALAGRLAKGTLGKWLGYVDQYVLFPAWLWILSGRWGVVHICDHSNAVYANWVRGKEASVTCHDLLGIQAGEGRFPEQKVGRTGQLLQRWIKRSLLRMRRVVCVSQNTARELAAMGSTAEIAVISNCLNNTFSPVDAASIGEMRVRTGLGERERYALQVGGNLWYKNRLGIARIFAEMLKRNEFAGMRLVMAGHTWTAELRDEVERLGLLGSAIELCDPDDATVRALYTGAEMLLFPSLYEGFGWPIVEAQSCGCVVITSKREPMIEVAGEGAILVDPDDAAAAATEISKEWPKREEICAAGFQNSKRFDADIAMTHYEAFLQRANRENDADS
jgi:glycosyltransferase involved in cell wall biosynthesis